MKARYFTGLFVLALSNSAAAESTSPSAHPSSAPDTRLFDARAELYMGVATAPFYSKSLPEAGGHALTVVAGGSWRVTRDFGVGVSVPVVATTVRQPAGAHVEEAAWGNPMLWAEGHVALWDRGSLRSSGRWRAGVGAPLAESGSRAMLSENRALAIADALRGWRDRELYAPGVVPAAVTAGVELEGPRFRAEATLKLVSLMRISDAGLASDDPRPFGLSSVFGLGGTALVTRAFGVGTRVYMVADPIPQAESPRARTLQWVLAPLLSFRVGPHVALDTELVAPIGGALGGDTFALGFHAKVAW